MVVEVVEAKVKSARIRREERRRSIRKMFSEMWAYAPIYAVRASSVLRVVSAHLGCFGDLAAS